MNGPDLIWRPDGGQRHRLLRLAPVRVQICRRANVHQNARSRYQMKGGVMYITHMPLNSTLDPYWERNQRWNFSSVQLNLLDFKNSKLNNDASMQRTSDHTKSRQMEQYIGCFKQKCTWAKPWNWDELSHYLWVLLQTEASMDQGEEV